MLNSAEPINDGGRKYNIIYYVSIAVCLITFISVGANGLGIIFSIILGLIVGWLIKNKILEKMSIALRNTKFKVENKIPYPGLINRLIPVLTPLGAMIEKSADNDRSPVISFQGAIYDIDYNEDNTFGIWWRKNLVKAIFTVGSIRAYRKEVVAMGIIGYHIQQVCDHYKEECNNQEIIDKKIVAEKKYCKHGGMSINEGAQFCGNCGKEL